MKNSQKKIPSPHQVTTIMVKVYLWTRSSNGRQVGKLMSLQPEFESQLSAFLYNVSKIVSSCVSFIIYSPVLPVLPVAPGGPKVDI